MFLVKFNLYHIITRNFLLYLNRRYLLNKLTYATKYKEDLSFFSFFCENLHVLCTNIALLYCQSRWVWIILSISSILMQYFVMLHCIWMENFSGTFLLNNNVVLFLCEQDSGGWCSWYCGSVIGSEGSLINGNKKFVSIKYYENIYIIHYICIQILHMCVFLIWVDLCSVAKQWHNISESVHLGINESFIFFLF